MDYFQMYCGHKTASALNRIRWLAECETQLEVEQTTVKKSFVKYAP